MLYQPHSCDLMAVGATNEIYRLNLDLGRFNTPLVSESPELNCIDYCPELNTTAVGGIDGRVEFWNLETKQRVLGMVPNGVGPDEEITAIRFEGNGSLNLAVGTQKGKILLYDMRYPLPMMTLHHQYRLPIQQIKYHHGSRKVLTCDKKIVKIYDKDSGKLFTNIEPKTAINDVELCSSDTGLVFVPQEQQRVGTFFLPSLGSAPKWCAFLENLTEEMEESKDTVLYEDYKFLTANDLQQLNATHLIGTPMLKAYMHGYFIEMRAYQKLLSVSDPFAFERYRKEQIT
jgi:ribosome biogenesis protein ENP2